MSLIDNQCIVSLQQRIALRLGQQNAIRHQFDIGVGTELVGKANLVANRLSQWTIQLGSNTRGNSPSRNAAWLRMADQAGHTALEFKADFRDLRGFTGAGLATNDYHLMILDGMFDFFAPDINRQIFRIRWAGKMSKTPCDVIGREFFHCDIYSIAQRGG